VTNPKAIPTTVASETPDAKTDAAVIPLADLLRSENAVQKAEPAPPVKEIGGRRDGPDPTRYGDWEKNGRCIDF